MTLTYQQNLQLPSPILTASSTNKSTGFTETERKELGLLGSLPYAVESLSSQVERCYLQFLAQSTPLQKNSYLKHVLDTSESIFYALVRQHLKEMLPILYTPTVGEVVQVFNQAFLRPRGLYLAWPHRHEIDQMLAAYQGNPIDIAVITDGERILGLGDQGVGGIEIAISKALVYTICGHLSPQRLLPIYIDVGTNNPILLQDPHYLGWRHERLKGKIYEDFIETIVTCLQKHFGNIYLHWEDLERDNAQRILKQYQTQLCTFNDDMQGTGIVTLASALNAIKITKVPLIKQRIIIFGGGAAGLGIADQLCEAMQREGLSPAQARANIWLIGRKGLLMTDSSNLTELQKPYARPASERTAYRTSSLEDSIDLLAVIQQIKPTFLIGCAGKAKAFTEEMIKTMAHHVERPIIFPLSNPTEHCEATPHDLLHWTKGKALIATGSPFKDVIFNEKTWSIAQCNNALVFPGLGLGIKASGATRVTNGMLWAACTALCKATSIDSFDQPCLLPSVEQIQLISKKIAQSVIEAAQIEGVAQYNENPKKLIELQTWEPGRSSLKTNQ